MTAQTLDYALLDPSDRVEKQPAYRRIAIVTSAFALMAGSVGFYLGSVHGAIGSPEAQLRKVAVNETELALASYTADCYGFTGGTCAAEKCNPERKAVCQDLKCICPSGCTGIDGTCRKDHYKKIASGVTFANKYWTSHWLYVQSVSVLSQLAASAAPAKTFGGSQLFDIYELPGEVNGRKQYFLTSNRWPDWVAAIRSTGSVLSLSASLWGLYAVDLNHPIAPWDPQGISVTICNVVSGGEVDANKAVMIGSSGKHLHPIWAYVHRMSALVYGWMLTSDPGTGGYWIPDQPLEGLQNC